MGTFAALYRRSELACPLRSAVPGQEHHPHSSNPERWFTLENLSEEIEFVGEAQYQLDVTSTPSLNASTNFIRPYAGSASLTLAVNGSLSEAAHRNLVIYSTIDFERLIKSPPHRGARDTEGPVAKFAPTPEERTGAAVPTVPCNRGTELDGFLGLQEDLTYHAITADMNDLSVWPAATGRLRPRFKLPTSSANGASTSSKSRSISPSMPMRAAVQVGC